MIMDAASGSFSSIVSALNTGLTADTLFSVVGQIMPWVITMTIACLGMSFLRKLIKGASHGKVKF